MQGSVQGSMQGTEFSSGAIVLVSLSNPREKFWGAILAISAAGVSLRGIDLQSFEDFMRQVKAGDEVAPGAVFFPMHRVERIELDQRNGEIPSMQDRFESKTGQSFHGLFSPAESSKI
jgi:hypothetical protein